MSRAIQKARDFTADFEKLFAWYVDKAGVEAALHGGSVKMRPREGEKVNCGCSLLMVSF